MNNEQLNNLINILGLGVGLMNLQENLTQNDKQELIQKFSDKAEYLLGEIHKHLTEQDKKLDVIIRKVGVDIE